MDIMNRVRSISNERVTVGPGTLYALLDRFLESGIIKETRIEGRRKSYIITDNGRELLQRENDRLWQMAREGDKLLGK